MKKLFKNLIYLSLITNLWACSSSTQISSNSASQVKIVDYGTDSSSEYIIARSTDPSLFMEIFSQNYKKIEEEIDAHSYKAAHSLMDLWGDFEEFLESAPKSITYYQEKTFEPIPLSEAVGSKCYVWIPEYREVAAGLIQSDGEIEGNGVVFDYIINQNTHNTALHLNYGTFKNGMLNGEGKSFRVDFDSTGFKDRLVVGKFINNRPDGVVSLVINMDATNERNTKAEGNQGNMKIYGINENGYSIIGYYEEDPNEGYAISDADDLYLTYYDRITNNTY